MLRAAGMPAAFIFFGKSGRADHITICGAEGQGHQDSRIQGFQGPGGTEACPESERSEPSGETRVGIGGIVLKCPGIGLCPYANERRFTKVCVLVGALIVAMTGISIAAIVVGKDGVITVAVDFAPNPSTSGAPAPKAVYAASSGRCTCTCDPLGRNRGAMSAAVCSILVGGIHRHRVTEQSQHDKKGGDNNAR